MLYVHCGGKFIVNESLICPNPLQMRLELGRF